MLGRAGQAEPEEGTKKAKKNKWSGKMSCATQLQVWYAMEKISLRLQFQCGEHLFLGGRKLFVFLIKRLCLFELKQSATSFDLFEARASAL